MILVIDASVTVASIAFDEEDAYADACIRALGEERGLVPALWSWEVTNTLLVLERRQRLNDAAATWADVRRTFPVDVEDDGRTLLLRAEELQVAARHALSVYGAAYLALAKRRAVPLATLDAQLARAAEAEGCFFRP